VAGEPASGDRFLFRGLAPFVADDRLRLLIVPSDLGRIVFNTPGPGALDAPAAASPTSEPLPVPAALDPLGVPDSSSLAPLSSEVVIADVAPPSPVSVIDGVGTSATPSTPAAQYVEPGGDFGTRAATAFVLAVGLGAFTVMQRGGSARLRPAQLRWRTR
jgi:hypothetical protein